MIGAIEGLLFRQRVAVLWFLAGVSLVVALSAFGLTMRLDPARHVPDSHQAGFADLRAAGAVEGEIAVRLTLMDGTLWTAQGLDHIQQAEEALRRVRGLDTSTIASILSPSILRSSAVEKAASFELQALLRDRPVRDWRVEDIAWWQAISAQLGLQNRLVTGDGRGALIRVLLDPDHSGTLDYRVLARDIDRALGLALNGRAVTAQVMGLPVRIGALDAMAARVMPAALGLIVAAALAFWLAGRSWMLTAAALGTAVIPMLWLAGALTLSGIVVDPLWLMAFAGVFALAVLTGCLVLARFVAQICWSVPAEEAARTVFREMALPGSVGLIGAGLCALSGAVMPVPVLRDLAVLCGLGVVLVVVSMLILLPLTLAALRHSELWVDAMSRRADRRERLLAALAPAASPRWAGAVAGLGLVLALGAGSAIFQAPIGSSVSVLTLGTDLEAAAEARRSFGYLADSYTVALRVDGGQCDAGAQLAQQVAAPLEDLASMPALAMAGPYPAFFGGREGTLYEVRQHPEGLVRSSPAMVRVEQVLNSDCSAVRLVSASDMGAPDAMLRLAQTRDELRMVAQGSTMDGAVRPGLTLGGGSLGALTMLEQTARDRMIFVILAVLGLSALGGWAALRDGRGAAIVLAPVGVAMAVTLWAALSVGLGYSVATIAVLVLTAMVGALAVFGLCALWGEAEEQGYGNAQAFVSAMSLGAPAIVLTAGTVALGCLALSAFPIPVMPVLGLGVVVQAVAALVMAPAMIVLSRWALPGDRLRTV